MTDDEVRAELEEQLGGPFAEATWKRLYDDEVKPFLDNQQSVTWQDVKHRADIGTLTLLGVALIVGRGVLRR